MFSDKSIKKYIILISLLILTIIFSGCSSVENPIIPPFPEAEEEPIELIIPEATKVIDPVTEQEIISIASDHSQIVFKKSTPQLEELMPGDIIVMGVTENTPEGLLRKIANITKGSKNSSEVVVETEFATIEEAIEQGSFYFKERLKPEDAKEPIYYLKGVEFIKDKSIIKDSTKGYLDFIYKIDVLLYDGDNNPKTEEDNIALTGQVSFSYELLLAGKIEFPHSLKELNYQNIVNIEKSLKVKIGGSAKLFQYEKVLFTQSLGHKIIWIGYLPFVLSPKITLKANVDGEIFADITAEVTDEEIFTAGIMYKNGTWQPISSHEYIPTDPSLSLSVGGEVTFGICPKLECKVDEVIGPYCGMNLYGKVIADIYENPWWKIYAGIKANAGVSIEIFSKKIVSADMLIFDLQKMIKQADEPFGGSNNAPIISSLIANPSNVGTNQVTTITCTASDPDDDSLTYAWTKSGGTFVGSTSGAIVTWRAPSSSDTYTVVCGVSDGKGGETTKSVDILVSDITPTNQAPYIPNTPSGPSSGKIGTSYSFSTYTTDPDGDNIAYMFDWGDGNISNWTSYVSSGNIVNQLHSYLAKGTYYIKTKAKDVNGAESLWSNSHKVTIDLEITVPGAPSKLSATTLSQNNIALVWQDNSNNETGFKIERKTGTTGTFVQIATIGATVGTSASVYYEDSGLTSSTSYCYRVRAYNSAGNSSYSNETCATTAPVALLPSATTGSATNITFNSVTLNGTVNPNGVETGAFFQWGTTASYGNLTNPQLLGSGTSNVNISTNLTGLSSNTTYHFRIVATNSNGGTIFGEDQLFITTHGTQNVTLVLYICENSTSGPPLSGVSVGVVDGGGNSSNHITNSSGYVMITGIPGTWHFSAMKSGYETNNWSQSITSSCTKYGYIIKSATPVGTIDVFATLNGSAWIGSLNYSLTGPSATSGSSVPAILNNKPVGTYNIYYNSGGPSNASLSSITPNSTQMLSTGGIIAFTLNFVTQTSSLGQVQLSSPSNGATLSPGNITFSWYSVSNTTKYQFILYNSKGQVALDTIKTSTSLVVALGIEETITWKVRAGDNSGNWGPWSSIWSLNIKSLT